MLCGLCDLTKVQNTSKSCRYPINKLKRKYYRPILNRFSFLPQLPFIPRYMIKGIVQLQNENDVTIYMLT